MIPENYLKRVAVAAAAVEAVEAVEAAVEAAVEPVADPEPEPEPVAVVAEPEPEPEPVAPAADEVPYYKPAHGHSWGCAIAQSGAKNHVLRCVLQPSTPLRYWVQNTSRIQNKDV